MIMLQEAALLTKSLKKPNKTKQNKKSKEAAKSLCQKMEQTNRSFAKNSKKLFLVHSNTNGKILGIFMDRHQYQGARNISEKNKQAQ